MANILLLGGSSSVGKTTAAARLGVELGWLHVQLDHYLHDLGDPRLQLVRYGPESWDLPAQELCQRLVAVSERASIYLEGLILGYHNRGNAAILEGEAIHPCLAERMMQTKGISSLYIIEADPGRMSKTLESRSSRYRGQADERRQTMVGMDQLYGMWLRSEAEARGIPWILSQPWETLAERILARCGLDARDQKTRPRRVTP